MTAPLSPPPSMWVSSPLFVENVPAGRVETSLLGSTESKIR